MDFNNKIKEIVNFLNEKNYKKIKSSLFSSNNEICLFCLDALKTELSLINLHDLITLFKQKKSSDVNNKILEILIDSIEESEELKKESYVIQFIKYLKGNLKEFQENEKFTLNLINLYNKFNLLEEEQIDDILHHSNDVVKIYTIGLLERDNKIFEKLVPFLKKSEEFRCAVLEKIPENIYPEFIEVVMDIMVNGTPKVQLTIINSFEDLGEISNLFIPMLKFALTIDYIRPYAIKLINKVGNADTNEIFIAEFDKLKKNKENRNFDTNYFISLIEAIGNSNNIGLFQIISEILNGYYTPCFQYALDYLFNVADDLNNDNWNAILLFLDLHRNILINEEMLFNKIIKFLEKTKHYESIVILIDISAETKNTERQNDAIELIEQLPLEKQRELLKNIDTELFNPKIQGQFELYRNALRFKKMSEFF